MKSPPITETDLHAYVDDALPLSRHQEVAYWLAAHPHEQSRLQAYAEQNATLHRLYDSVLDEPIPALLQSPQPRQPKLPARPAWSRWPFDKIAASLLLTLGAGLLGAVAGWTLHAGQTQTLAAKQFNIKVSSLPHQAAIAHAVFTPEVKHPVEVGADQQEQLVKWLSKRLGSTIRPPTLATQGYDLVGGRLLPGNSGPVAQFMYQNISGQRLTLYLSNENRQNQDTGFQFLQEGQINVFYWIDGKFGYALSGGIDKGELSRIASLVYEQLQSN
ncbi:MAG: anti-sigma factor [Undibacterium sp.]|uniref:anti-sigma factor family protein n=1 Tax=Undibacterium sp. TaxID=1914977 RepID=UPI00272728B2|nr:anti-sigma factor [Undibacterium sp.]MDO8650599.1 anti-sigma factor [Undibacterium sp.]